MGKITVKNISSAFVVISAPEIKFRRELVPGRTIPLTTEEYNDLVFEPGFENLVTGGYIKVEGVEEDQTSFEAPDTYSAEEIRSMLEARDITRFAQFIPNAPDAAKESAVQIAVELGVTDNAFVALIKKYCGVDVIDAISRKHQLED